MAKKAAKRVRDPFREIPLRVATRVDTTRLHFDPSNPRLLIAGDLDTNDDAKVIAFLHQEADLQELVQSIAANGYIDIEPLVVTVSKRKLIVLEGNRRLAALRLLSNAEIGQELGIPVPAVSRDKIATFKTIHVYRVSDRLEAREFIGFKHINGPHKWDALAKAQFSATWYEKGKREGLTVRDVAKHLGDRHDTVHRLISGYFVLMQAEKEKIFEIDDAFLGRRTFPFSHLYTALTRPGFRDYLDLPADWRSTEPERDPVPNDRLENLQRVMRWLFGSRQDNIAPLVTSQNPHVKYLARILEKAEARKTLLATNDLAKAYAIVETPSLRFETTLIQAKEYAEQAQGLIDAFDGRDETLLETSGRLKAIATTIHGVMEDCAKKASRKAN